MNGDRVLELQLAQFVPFWREMLAIWLGSIALLAFIQVVLHWMGRDRPGEFAKLLGLPATLCVMALPGLVALYLALGLSDSHGLLAAMGAMLGLPVAAIYIAAKLKRFLVWSLTRFGKGFRNPRGQVGKVSGGLPDTGNRPLLNGKPLD